MSKRSWLVSSFGIPVSAATVLGLLLVPPPASPAELASTQLQIAGTRLTVSPEGQTVPFDTPTIVETRLEGYQPGAGALPADLRVVADFTGPEIDGILELETVPNEPFRIPRLRLKGDYALSNIRLVQGDGLLAYAEPRDVSLLVTQILVTRVSSRALTLDEIRSYGIVIDDGSFQAFNLTFGFGIDGQVIDYNVPVIFSRTGDGIDRLIQARVQPQGSAESRFSPPQLVPFTLSFAGPEEDEIPTGGCPTLNCRVDDPGPPLVGVILFPTDIRLLHQFFSVVLMVQNGAPEGDPLVVRDLTARIHLPPGLREASTEPPTPLGVPVPVRVPGADGRLGTGDDLNFLIAQAEGEAAYLVEGLKEGTHITDFELEGVLEGLPTGIKRITGRARGAVVVRDPSLAVTIAHPDVVRVDEEYSVYFTVANTGNAPVNLLSLSLPPSGLSGVELLSPNEQTIDTLLPGDSDVLDFRVRSKRTGRVVASSVQAGSSIQPHFEFHLGVGESGIPLSPDTLVLPKRAEALPAELYRWSLGLVGLGHSLATAPPSLVSDLPRVGLDEVQRRIYRLSQAGQYLELGEDPFDVLAVMAAEWNGARDGSWGWDELRRGTDKGGLVAAELSKVFTARAQASSVREVVDRLAAVTHFLPPQQAALAAGSGVSVEVSSRTSGKAVWGSGVDPQRSRELPFAELFTLGQGELVLLSSPEDGGYRARLFDADGGLSDLHLLVPGVGGELRIARWLGVDLLPAGEAVVDFQTADASFVMHVDRDGDGFEDAQLMALLDTVAPRPFEVLVARQSVAKDPSGHVVDVLFSADVDLATLWPKDATHFELPGKVSNGGVIPSELNFGGILAGGQQVNPLQGLRDTRIVQVVFDNPISPLVTHEMTIRQIGAVTGELLTEQSVPVEITVDTPGVQVEGVVSGADGEPVPFAPVTLHESDPCVHCVESCRSRQTAAVLTDAQGLYRFDYVRATECSDVFTITALDPASQESGTVQSRVRLGGVQQVDVVMVGRGRIEGRALYEDGSVPDGLEVIATNAVFGEGRLAHVDDEGFYEVGEVIVGTVTLSAKDVEGNFVFQTVEVPKAGAVVRRDLTIIRLAQPTGEVRGTIFEPDGVTPAVDAYLALYVDAQLVKVEHSAIDGSFDFGRVPAGVAEIEAFDGATRQQGAQLFFEVAPDQTQQLSLTLQSARGTVEGTVYRQAPNGALTPLSGAVVWAANLPFNTVTDALGAYRLEGVFSGQRTIRAADIEAGEIVSGSVTVASGMTVQRDLLFVQGLADGGLAGEVLDFDGAPVTGAIVHLASGYNSHDWHFEAITDFNGRFAIPDLPPGRYGVHATKGAAGGLQFAEIRFQGDTPFVTVRFRKGTIRGRTQTKLEDGTLQGVLSQVVYRTVVVQEGLVGVDWIPRTLETDGEGFFELTDVLIGPYELSVHNAFHGTRKLTGELIQHGDIVEHDFIFEPNGEIRGVVFDHDGATPVAGVTVSLLGGAFEDFDITTDAEGRFVMALVPPGRYRLAAHFDDGVLFRQELVYANLNQAGDELDVEIVLPKQGTVKGFVEDANLFPVPGAVVTLHERSYPYRTLVHNADGEGHFQFNNVFSGKVTINAQAPLLGGIGGKDNVELVEEGQEVLAIVTLEEVGEVAGTVFTPVDGSAVPQARVNLYRGDGSFFDSLNTDAEGEFRFRLLPLGPYFLRVFDPVTGRHGLSATVEVVENNQLVRADVTLEVRGAVDGHLTEPRSGVGVPGATIQLCSTSLARLTAYSSTDVAGAFEFLGIPEGDFELRTREPFGRRRAQGNGSISVEGERVTVDLVLEDPGRVIGSVLNPPGRTEGLFAGVNTRIVQSDEGLAATIGATLENPFAFDGVLAGRPFEILAEEVGGPRRGRTSGELAEEGGELMVDFQMEAVGTVTVSVVDSTGEPVPGADVELWDRGIYGGLSRSFSASTGQDHRASFSDVREGELSAVATHPVTQLSGSASGFLALDGENVELEVRLQPSGTVRGQALLADGVSPAEGATVALIGPQSYVRTTDAEGRFELLAIPLGSFRLVLQESFGRGTLERFLSLGEGGEVADLGTLVLDDFDPQVVAVSPPTGTRDLSHDTTVTVTFSEPMWSSRSDGALSLRRLSGGGVAATRVWSADGTQVTLTPASPLANATAYEIIVTTAALDAAGRPLPAAVRSAFYTADLLPPTVIDVVPAGGAVQVPVDASILITFSEPVDLASLSGAALQLFDLTAGAGITTTFQLRPGERQLLLTPIAALSNDRQIQLTVQNVRDTVGNVMTQAMSTTFWTPDATPPEITLIEPAAGEAFTAGDPIPASANASDNRGVGRVDFLIGDWVFSDPSSPYAATLIAPVVATAGDVVVTGTAVDIFGNTTSVTRTIHVDPHLNGVPPAVEAVCWSDGDRVQPGIEIPFSYRASDDERVESVTLRVNGQVVDRSTPVNTPETEGTFFWTPPSDAPAGAPFEVRIEARDFAGNVTAAVGSLSVPAAGELTLGDLFLDASFAGQALMLSRGTFVLDVPLQLQSLTLLHGATLTTRAGLDLDVAGELRLQCGATIDVSGQGYAGGAGGPGEAPSWVAPSHPESGGSHGGAGVMDVGGVGEVYDSVYRPQLAGAGGARHHPVIAANAGGSFLFVDAAAVVLNGQILARGGAEAGTPAGAGGSVRIETASLRGDGTVDASGGDIAGGIGAGGGGRVALVAATTLDFDPLAQVVARGGSRRGNNQEIPPFGTAGTIYLRGPASTYGELVVSNGNGAGDDPRSELVTELPALGAAAVTTTEVEGTDVWVTAGTPFRPRWLGAWMVLLDGGGAELGAFEVVDLNGAGQVRLASASAVSAAASFRGEYRFDRLRLVNARLVSGDLGRLGSVEVRGEASFPPQLSVDELVVRDGGTLFPAAGSELLIDATGTITVETGGAIDVTGTGYPVGPVGGPGGAPSWVTAALPDSGGSHGGVGATLVFPGPSGEVFDSVYLPQLPGGGGATARSNGGGAGGGVLYLRAGAVVLDGELRARGEKGTHGHGSEGGAGGGGTVRIEAAVLSGTGLIDASGGDSPRTSFDASGIGGGGRVALWVGDLSAFDPQAQVRVWSGLWAAATSVPPFGSPGTIFVADGAATYGHLILDAGTHDGGAPRGSLPTELPTLGSGPVSGQSVAGTDLWVESAEPFRARWLGAWMGLGDGAGGELGTFRVAEIDAGGRVRLEGAAGVATAASYAGEYRFDSVEILNGVSLTAADPLAGVSIVFASDTELNAEISATDVLVRSGATVRPLSGSSLHFEASGTVTVEAGGVIDVSGVGYPRGAINEPAGAPEWVGPSFPDAGGSHGGFGAPLEGAGPAGDVFDSVYRPQLPGGGGATFRGVGGGAGGGVLSIRASAVVLDGELRVRGEQGTHGHGSEGGGGGGGSLWIEAGTLSGTGLIDASGGDAPLTSFGTAGVGGGGRVALRIGELSGFDPGSQVQVRSGLRTTISPPFDTPPFGSPGTIFFADTAATYGSLIVDPGTLGDGSVRGAVVTELPALGSGAVLAQTVEGGDLRVESAEPFQPRWLGAWMVLLDATGAELGTFQVREIGPAGGALLEGAGAVAAAASYRGEYRFDSVELHNGAGLVASDPVGAAMLTVQGEAELSAPVALGDVVVSAGSTLRPAVPGDFHLVAETVTVGPGAAIDVSGMGFAGGPVGEPGGAPLGVDPSSGNAGGSHGGPGDIGTRFPGTVGEVYDSVYNPLFPGAGGGSQGPIAGGAGGGLLRIDAATVQLDGTLRSRGAAGFGVRGEGAGGTVVIEAATLAGSGAIDVSGNDVVGLTAGIPAPSGGGRIAIRVGDQSGFTPSEIVVRGGGRGMAPSVTGPFAGPGTYFSFWSTSVYGDLLIDGGFANPSPTTRLPAIGRGVVGQILPDGTGLWIEPLDPDTRFGVGVAGMWVRIAAVDYPVKAERADRRGLLLEGAAGAVSVGDAYVGIYKFDTVTLRGGAQLELLDDADVGSYDIEAGSAVFLPDLTPPVISNVVPAEGAVYAAGSVIAASAEVSDDTGVVSVTFRLDGASFTDDTPPYAQTLIAPAVTSPAMKLLEVEAVDPAGNASVATRSLQIEPVSSGAPPTASILSPTPAAPIAPGTGLDVTVEAADDEGVSRVELYLGGVLQVTNFEAPWIGRVIAPTAAVDGELLTLLAVAYDAGAQTGTASLDLRVVGGEVIVSDRLIRAGDTSLDGGSVIVAGGTLRIEGAHTFDDLVVLDGGVLSHPPTTPTPPEPDDSLVGYWPFDDGADPSTDLSATGAAARLGSVAGSDNNDPAYLCDAGAIAPTPSNACALRLTGAADEVVGDFAVVPNRPELDFTEAYSLSAWILFNDVIDAPVAVFVRGANDGVTHGNDIDIHIEQGSRRLGVAHNRTNGGQTVQSSNFVPIPIGQLFHLAVTFDGTRARVYYDGVEQLRVAGTATLAKPLALGYDWLFGKVNHFHFVTFGTTGVKFFDGILDEVRFFSRALSPEEVRAVGVGAGFGAHGLELTLSGELYVAKGGAIDASGLGYPGGDPRGTSYPNTAAEGAGTGVGGSHGGRGGSWDGSGNVYGSLFAPQDPGAGGGGAGAKAGGGVIRVEAAGTIRVEGAVRANGDAGGPAAPFGAGGSIHLQGASLSGGGTIEASGGGSSTAQPGGGGGRIALVAGSIDDGLLGRTSVLGGESSAAGSRGAAGTLYLKRGAQARGELIVDGGGVASSQLTELVSVGDGVVATVRADGFSDALGQFRHSLAGVEVGFNGSFAEPWPVVGNTHRSQSLYLEVTGHPLTAAVGDSYGGLYRFDRVTVRGGSRVVARDGISSLEPVSVEAGAELIDDHSSSVLIADPPEGASFNSGENVSVTAAAEDALYGVASAALTFNGTTETLTTPPFNWTVALPVVTEAATIELELTAVDLTGQATSASRLIQILPVASGAPPTASIVSPSPGTPIVPGGSVRVIVDAMDDEEVAKVELYLDGVLHLTDSEAPWTGSVVAPATVLDGELLTLQAVAYDNGAQTGSASLQLRAVQGEVVGTNRLLTAGDTSLDGGPVIVSGTLVVEGAHTFRDLLVLDGGLVSHSPTPAAPDNDLVGYWSFDDGSDPSGDLSRTGAAAQLGSGPGGDSNDPAYLCSPVSIAPTPGNVCGLQLSGGTDGATSDFAVVPNRPELDFTDAYTLSAWILFNDVTDAPISIFARGADDGVTNGNDIDIHLEQGNRRLGVAHNRTNGGQVGQSSNFVPIPTGQLFHLAVTFDGTTARVYYDGVEQTRVAGTATLVKPLALGYDWLFGKVNHFHFRTFGTTRVKFFDGILDEVRFYDRQLTAEEIQGVMLGSDFRGERLDLTLTGDLYVAPGGAVDVSGKGYLGGEPRGNSYPNSGLGGATPGVGGTHGGRGGGWEGSGEGYGNLFTPRDPGAGGGGPGGKAGGGVVQIVAAGAIRIDGAVRANGDPLGSPAPFGAGGSILLDGSSLAGLGLIEASGGGSATGHPGGGGGRIALFGALIDEDLLSRTSALGGESATPENRGAAGTLFVRRDGQPLGELIVDAGGVGSTHYTELVSVGGGVADAVAADGFSDFEASFRHSLVGAEVGFNGSFAELWAIEGHEHHGQELHLDITGHPLTALAGDSYKGLYRFDRLVVRGGARLLSLDVISSVLPVEVEAGSVLRDDYSPAVTIATPVSGSSFTSGATMAVMAAVDSLYGVESVALLFNGSAETLTGDPYSWSVNLPVVSTPTPYPVQVDLVDLLGTPSSATHTINVVPLADAVPPTLTVVDCPADQDRVVPGTPLLFPFSASDDTGIGNYRFTVNGATVAEASSLGVTELSESVSWTVPADAAAGSVYTLRLEVQDFGANITADQRQLVAAGAPFLAGSQLLDASLNGSALTLGDGVFTVTDPLFLSSLVLAHGATLTGTPGQPLELDLISGLEVQCGATIDVVGLGFPGGHPANEGQAPAGIGPAHQYGGGSHGGSGSHGSQVAMVGEIFDSVYLPTLAGGGGGRGSGPEPGGAGGGVLRVEAAAVVLDGTLLAAGEGLAHSQAGSGAGGTVSIVAGSLAGAGLIDVSGADYQRTETFYAGLGGGGRVALYVDDLSGFDPLTQVTMKGGTRYGLDGSVELDATPGTLFLFDAGSVYGELVVAGGVADRMVAVTELPELGSGALATTSVEGADSWVTAAAPFKARWAGTWMRLADGGGTDLGSFRVSEVDTEGRARLAGAAGVAGSALSYAGLYLFDEVSLRSGGGLNTVDPIRSTYVELAGDVLVPTRLSATNLLVRSGAVVSPSFGDTLELEVAGTLTLEAGSLISLGSLGYLGGLSPSEGGAPPEIAPSQQYGGGSHGGAGTHGSQVAAVSEVYDSVYHPGLGGGGGGRGSGPQPGGAGGGVLRIEAGSVVLNGELSAVGEGLADSQAGGGAGGTVSIVAGSLAGSGRIDVSAADYQRTATYFAGLGGGGRVALHVGDLLGFDLASGVKLKGGTRLGIDGSVEADAAPGTLLVFDSGSLYGDLTIDGGSPARTLPTTQLPKLGSGSVTASVADGADA